MYSHSKYYSVAENMLRSHTDFSEKKIISPKIVG